MDFLKRRLPTLIVLIVGFLMIGTFFVPMEASEALSKGATKWIRLIAAFTLIIGISSLLRAHVRKIYNMSAGWGYSLTLILSFLTMTILGFTKGIEDGTYFMWAFNNIQFPLAATTFSLTAFFICSASYRAFRARNIEATIMLIAAIIVMVGRIPFGEMLTDALPQNIKFLGLDNMTSFILDVFNMSARRAVLLGVALGGIATSLRIILGIERSYQGKD